jgi:hypothetical protein
MLERRTARSAIFCGGGLVSSRTGQQMVWGAERLAADRLTPIDRIRGAATWCRRKR